VVTALAAQTEGWAAGLQLAGLSLRGQEDVAAFVATFTGSHRHVLDFLAEEVLERQDGQLRTFLLETSVLERLSGELCDAVTGGSGSQALLEQVERAGLFLVPLDEVRGWWRYHHLFADLLRARLQAEQPSRAAQLHDNAAAWSQEHGLADDAIRHAMAAGELTWAAGLIEQYFDGTWRWLVAVPGALPYSRPWALSPGNQVTELPPCTILSADSVRVVVALDARPIARGTSCSGSKDGVPDGGTIAGVQPLVSC
jgi:hypothetical protein